MNGPSMFEPLKFYCSSHSRVGILCLKKLMVNFCTKDATNALHTEDPRYNDSVCYQRFCCKIEFAVIEQLDMDPSIA